MRKEWNLLWFCVHPDTRKTVSDKKPNDAAALLSTNELVLLAENDNPTPVGDRPRTYADLMTMKRKVQEERRAKRNARSEPEPT